MAHDPEGVIEFKAASKKYRLYFGMRANKAVELHYDLPFFLAIQKAMPMLSAEDMGDKAKVAAATMELRLTDVAKLFEFALLKHHPDIEEDEVDDLIDIIGLSKASELLGNALTAAMNEEDGSADAPPPKAGQKKPTGSRSLVTG